MTLETYLPPGFKAKSQHEFCGPCPKCGGRDRLVVNRTWRQGRGGFECRQCGLKGDLIDFLREAAGLGYREARAALGMAPDSPLARQDRTPAPRIADSPMPPDRWSMTAARLAAQFGIRERARLDPRCMDELDRRGLDAKAAQALGLFWIGRARYGDRGAWGLAPRPDGGLKLKIPAGLGYCVKRAGRIVGMTIRNIDFDGARPETGPKYWELAGSARGRAVIYGEKGASVFIFESAFDAGLAFWEGRGAIAAIALQGAGKKLDDMARSYLAAAPQIVLAYDDDDAGRTIWPKIKAAYPDAYSWKAIAAKDIGEMAQARRANPDIPEVREWLAWALWEAHRASERAAPSSPPPEPERPEDKEEKRQAGVWNRKDFCAGLLRGANELAARYGISTESFLDACGQVGFSPLDYRVYYGPDFRRAVKEAAQCA